MNKKGLFALGAAALTGIIAAQAALASEAAYSLASKRKSILFDLTRKQEDKLIAPPAGMENAVADSMTALRDTPMETVSAVSHDGLTLTGHWYPAENPLRIVIMFHGWRSSWYHDFGMSADFMHDSGCSLLYVEQRSHGKSEGKYISYGIKERYDVQTWVDFAAEKNTDNLPVYLCGISMGATTVLMASELPLKNTVKGIIADCGFTSGEAILKSIIDENIHVLPKSVVYKYVDRTFRRHTGMSYGEYSTLDAMKNCHIPVLFIHGENDAFVPVSMT
ncbi:MAG: alpha/beta hydrolase, partial [Oscillospiraceae bacterium]|nr:alpha/beta hydrolase [Oscillospiraceae bacterium]